MKAMKLMLVMMALVALEACGGVVRDAATYDQELRLMGHITATMAQQQLGEAEAAAKAGNQIRCVALADTALVAAIRVPWHLAMARHLAELDDDDPAEPGELPEVPIAVEWCKQKAAPAVGGAS